MKRAGPDEVIASAAIVSEEAERWAALYQQVRPNLVRALAAAAGTYEGVEDAIQEAFATAIQHTPADLRSPEAWLFVVALNKLRSQRRRTRLAARFRIIAPPERNEFDEVLRRADVVATLGLLSERERTLLVSKYYVGMTQEEIARQLGMRRGSVAAAVSRAAAHFRELEKCRG
jgi:RNA polymerase sigma factor (sigma-70 family)